jgi:hypothetical protein
MCGDTIDGRIGEVNEDVYLEYDELMRRTFTSMPLYDLGRPIRMGSLEVVQENGLGNSYVRDPKSRISWSDDGGRTYSNELFRDVGKIGEYGRRTIWRKLGRAPRWRTIRFEYAENTKFSLIEMVINRAR